MTPEIAERLRERLDVAYPARATPSNASVNEASAAERTKEEPHE